MGAGAVFCHLLGGPGRAAEPECLFREAAGEMVINYIYKPVKY